MFNRSLNLLRRPNHIPSRMLAACTPEGLPKSLVKLRKLQAEYQCEDGKPIWLKAGIRDRILYSCTIIGCYVGVLMVLGCIYDNAKPPSWKTAC